MTRYLLKYFPKTETIAMYASVKNIRNKTDEDFKWLRVLWINEQHIDVESGLDDALKLMNKGYTTDEAIYELKRLRNAGIDYGANSLNSFETVSVKRTISEF